MPSNARSEPLDLERGLPTSQGDVEALHRLRLSGPVPTLDFLRFLALLSPPSQEQLRARPVPRGAEPFKL